mgnify:CR=1 FL=1
MGIFERKGEKTSEKRETGLPWLLKYYESSDFAIQQRVRFMFYLCISAIVGLILLVFSTGYEQLTSPNYGSLFFPVILPELIILLLLFTSLFFLIKGFYGFAAHLLLISPLIGVWFVMWVDRGEVISRLDTVVFILAILSMKKIKTN